MRKSRKPLIVRFSRESTHLMRLSRLLSARQLPFRRCWRKLPLRKEKAKAMSGRLTKQERVKLSQELKKRAQRQPHLLPGERKEAMRLERQRVVAGRRGAVRGDLCGSRDIN